MMMVTMVVVLVLVVGGGDGRRVVCGGPGCGRGHLIEQMSPVLAAER